MKCWWVKSSCDRYECCNPVILSCRLPCAWVYSRRIVFAWAPTAVETQQSASPTDVLNRSVCLSHAHVHGTWEQRERVTAGNIAMADEQGTFQPHVTQHPSLLPRFPLVFLFSFPRDVCAERPHELVISTFTCYALIGRGFIGPGIWRCKTNTIMEHDLRAFPHLCTCQSINLGSGSNRCVCVRVCERDFVYVNVNLISFTHGVLMTCES